MTGQPDRPLSPARAKTRREKALQNALSALLPDGKGAYFFCPLLIWHADGSCAGVLGSSDVALAWQRGLTDQQRTRFYLTDIDGNSVTVHDTPSAPGHAYTIMDTLNRNRPA